MQWYGKALGGIIGLVVAGPWGSLVGALLGHQLDQGGAAFLRGGRRETRGISQLFFDVAFEVMGRVAKIDGRVSEDEVRAARAIMHGMRLTADQVDAAIERFTSGKGDDYPLAERLGALDRQIGGGDLARAFVQLQLQAALGAGPIGPEKRQMLWYVASALHVSRAELDQIERFVRAQGEHAARAESLDDAYRVLGVATSASDDEVKKAYRRLMNQHHPDKLVARGLPESMIGIAEQKTHEVRAAYEKVKARRGFK
ncbi:MAG TPA: co-chaperone DjlA [Gammaproteobacteria bacterium]|nr:co-chaperone DjlA [Gammaproteobacteria bacterium]